MKPKRQTNKDFSENDTVFNQCCSEIRITPTKRQASKFRRRKGLAFNYLKKSTENEKTSGG